MPPIAVAWMLHACHAVSTRMRVNLRVEEARTEPRSSNYEENLRLAKRDSKMLGLLLGS
jgi:hypothetical protein